MRLVRHANRVRVTFFAIVPLWSQAVNLKILEVIFIKELAHA